MLKLFLVFIFAAPFFQTSASFGLLPPAALRANPEAIDVVNLMAALGLPQCVHKCIDPFIEHLHGALQLKDTIEHYDILCASYANTTECIEANPACVNDRVYRVATSGINNICTRKRKYIEKNRFCLQQYLDDKANACDAKCQMIKSIAEVSHNPQVQFLAQHGGDMVRVLGTIGPICTAAECYLPCFRDQMNMVCPRAGGMFVDALLKPFHFLAAYIEESGALVKTFVANKMPPSCKYLINEDTLSKIRKSSQKDDFIH